MAAKAQLGRLTRVDPREYWKNEVRDFTPWLAELDNLALLAETLGMEVELQSTEQNVGPFRADILCKEVGSDRIILVENQLERTDHIHLGQILTYAAGLNAVVIVWIAPEFTDEHRAALDWLNRITNESVNFFGLEIELWKIGQSDKAPKFNIICQPNDWSRQVATASNQGVTPMQSLQFDYWAGYGEYLKAQKYPGKIPKPQIGNWVSQGLGRGGFYLSPQIAVNPIATGKGPTISFYLNIYNNDAKYYFDLLYADKEAIEKELGYTVEWGRFEGGKSSYISTKFSADCRNRDDWHNQFKWFYSHLVKFQQVFGPRIKSLPSAPKNEENT